MCNIFDSEREHDLLDSGETSDEEPNSIREWTKTWGGGEENDTELSFYAMPAYAPETTSPFGVTNYRVMSTAEKLAVYSSKTSEEGVCIDVWDEMSKATPTAFVSHATLLPTQMPTPTAFVSHATLPPMKMPAPHAHVAAPTLPHAKCKATIQKTPTPPKKLGTPTKIPTPARLLANRQAADRSRKNAAAKVVLLEKQAELHAVEKAEMLALHATVMQQAENATKMLQETNTKLLYSETLLASTLATLAKYQRSV
jgi:hypothetical protein